MFPKRTPGESRKQRTWTFCKVEPNTVITGWKAGDCVWVETHFVKASKPCKEAMTGGALPCTIDHLKFPLEWTGYFPFYDSIGRPSVAIAKEYSQKLLTSLKLHSPIRVRRGASKTEPVVIEATGSTVKFETTCHDRMTSADLRPWLLTLWKDAELVAWVEDGCGMGDSVPLDIPMPEFAARIPGQIEATGPTLAELKEKRKRSAADEERYQNALALAKFRSRGSPSVNGTHAGGK